MRDTPHVRLRNTLLLALAAIAIQSPLWSGVQPAWTVHYNGGLSRSTNQVVALRLDAEGNILIAGSSTGAAGDYDYLVLKYGPDGRRMWVARHASLNNGDDQLRAMALDAQGNVLVTGTSVTAKYLTNGTEAWTAPFAGQDVAVANDGSIYVTGFSTTDFSTAKLNSSGSNVWVRLKDLFGLGYKDHSDKVATDEAGNVYVAGGGDWGCQFFPPPRPTICYASHGIVSYDGEGGHRWTSTFPFQLSLSGPETVALSVLGSHVYFCGKILGGWSFYLARFDLDGAEEWKQGFGIADDSDAGASAIGMSDENATYVTGGSIIDRYSNRAYRTLKADAAGAPQWEVRYNNNGVNPGFHRARAMALDRQVNIYVTGESANFNGDLDWATIKYTPDGKEQWVIREDGPAHSDDKATAIAVDGSGNIYVAGSQTKTNGLIELVLIKYSELDNIRVEPDNRVAIQFFATPGQLCRFQATTNFPNWSDVGSAVASTDGIVRFTDTNAPAYPHRFYRFVSP
jgi:hypothetical protein